MSAQAGRRSAASSPIFGAKSPNKLMRHQEKEELQHLNDRLATYIERVRYLEEMNSNLTAEITTTRESVTREIEGVKHGYEAEITDIRRLLDLTAKEKAQEQIENSKNAALASDYKTKLAKETAARKKVEDALKGTQKQLTDKEAQLSRANIEAKNLESVVHELRKECQELKESLESAKYALEQETLTRVDLENKLQSAKEELSFKSQMYNTDLSELRSQMKVVETRKITVETDYKNKYEGILIEKLNELREEYQIDMQGFREESETLYITKTQHLEKRVEDLQRLREQDQKRYDETIASKEEENREMRQAISDALQDYEDLMGVKLALDAELSAYRKLLEGEERRLNISPPVSPVFGESGQSGRKRSSRSAKRARTEETESISTTSTAEGDIQIVEADPEGNFIKLFNTGAEDAPLGGWTLERQVEEEPPLVFKFTPKYALKAGNYVTIWSSEGGGQHKPPSELIFKHQLTWGSGNEVRTTLIDPEGKGMASFKEEKVVTTYSSDYIDSREPAKGKRTEVNKGCVIQ